MKRRFDDTFDAARIATVTSKVLADWYAFHSSVRRLCAIEDPRGIRVLLALEPTHDGSDTSPAWFANSDAWATELRMQLDRPIALELIADPTLEEIEINGEGVVVVDLCWRDPCMFSI